MVPSEGANFELGWIYLYESAVFSLSLQFGCCYRAYLCGLAVWRQIPTVSLVLAIPRWSPIENRMPQYQVFWYIFSFCLCLHDDELCCCLQYMQIWNISVTSMKVSSKERRSEHLWSSTENAQNSHNFRRSSSNLKPHLSMHLKILFWKLPQSATRFCFRPLPNAWTKTQSITYSGLWELWITMAKTRSFGMSLGQRSKATMAEKGETSRKTKQQDPRSANVSSTRKKPQNLKNAAPQTNSSKDKGLVTICKMQYTARWCVSEEDREEPGTVPFSTTEAAAATVC